MTASRDQATQDPLLAALVHELRTPIAAILGLAVTLEREQLRTAEVKDLAERIAANADRLDRMVADLLDLDRLSRGLVEPNVWPVDLGALAERVVGRSGLASGREVSVEAEDVVAEIDESKVERILENLLANAVVHTAPDARVWVSVRGDGDGAVIIVEDEGPGVPAEQREAIFEPFRKSGTVEDSPGAGIGLALVARFAEIHGGRAWVEPRDPAGASFRVWLPARAGS
ncbi:MAG: sensor histidine kinase [Actinomycetota bacterium]